MPSSKNNERKEIRNNRPITVLPVVDNTFEKLQSKVTNH